MGYAGGQHGTTTASQKEQLHSLSVLWQSSSTQKPERNREICWNTTQNPLNREICWNTTQNPLNREICWNTTQNPLKGFG